MNKSKIETVDKYIASFEGEARKKLKIMRKLTKAIAPKAAEKISYHIPTYTLDGLLLYFAAYKRHIGFYPFSSAIKAFKKELASYKTSKGAVQFPLDRPLPEALIKKMIRFRVGENLAKKRKSGATIKS
ncbi:MAG TPA: DUF1801 domain-containing protein [Candidatus Paceibacterota bacterium]|nr:DUF1801 domain-containing protein [Candidatus Paceibacterota bacterium]